MSRPPPLPDLVDRVADYTLADHAGDSPWLGRDLESHDWEKGVAVNGLLATGRHPDRTRAVVDRCVETQTGEGQFSYGSLDVKRLDWEVDWESRDSYTSIADPVVPGHGVLECYARTGEESYLDAARRQYEFLQGVERTDEGGIPQRREALELWVDTLYMVCPFLARYGALADDPDAVDDAVRQVELQRDRLRDPRTGLYRHVWRQRPDGFDQSAFWSRGNGWAAAGLVDTHRFLPEDHPDRPAVAAAFRELAGTLLDYQDASGFWHNVVDDPGEPLETSGTLMFAYSFLEGLEQGVLEGDAFGAAAERAMAVSTGVVDEDGGVRRVAKVPGGPEAPLGVTLHGQGWFLLAASRFG